MSAPTVTEQWSDHVAAGEAYCSRGFQNIVAGQIPLVQLFNPVDSGVRVRLRVMQPMAVFAFPINTNIRRHDTALTTLGPFGVIENLLGGGVAASAEIRTMTQVAMAGSPFQLILSGGNNRSAYPEDGMEWGHDLLEGEGIMLNGVTGGFIFCGFMWAEVPL